MQDLTRAEAIAELREMRTDAWTDARQMQALEMAIKALEREPSGDCISRQATLEPYKDLNDDDVISVWLIRKNIEQQPSVTPTVIEDIKAEIAEEKDVTLNEDINYSEGLERALVIIDKHIGGDANG